MMQLTKSLFKFHRHCYLISFNNFLRDAYKRSSTYSCPKILLENRIVPRINIHKRHNSFRIGWVARHKHHRWAKMGCCYSGTESLWYGSWNHHACRKGKCKVDRPSRLTEADPSRKRKCCSPSCRQCQAQFDTPDWDNFKVWVVNEQYVIDLSICEIELRCLPFLTDREQRLYEFRFVWVQFVPLGMSIICLKTFLAKTTKMSTKNQSLLVMSCFSNQSL